MFNLFLFNNLTSPCGCLLGWLHFGGGLCKPCGNEHWRSPTN
jgi:hypothetical protein